MSDKEDPVARDHRLILRMFVVGVVVMLFAVSVYGVWNNANPLEHHDAWVRYISHYQTLIGGFLAVAAAYITVRQMRKSDQRADKRHEDLMKLQFWDVREGRMTLTRLTSKRLMLHHDAILDNMDHLKIWKNSLPDQEQSDIRFRIVAGELEKTYEVLRSPEWDEYKKYLSAETRVAREDLLYIVRQTTSVQILRWTSRFKRGEEFYVSITADNIHLVDELIMNLNLVSAKIQRLVDGMGGEN